MKQPMQKIYTDEHGTIRFRPNRLVQYLLDNGGLSMNDLALVDCPKSDREQFAQLIGYSVSGFYGLSYVREKTADKAMSRARKNK